MSDTIKLTITAHHEQACSSSWNKHMEVLDELCGEDIIEIGGLDGFINLRELMLGVNLITEMSNFKDLVNLCILDLYDNKITEIKGLEKLINLRNLDLRSNKITEIKGLKTLVNLQQLWLDRCLTLEINYLNIPDSLIYPSELIKGKKICLKAKLLLDKIMIVNTVKWWF